MELAIVNPSPRWPSATLREPLPYGYIHLAAVVEPPRQPGPPFPGRSERETALLVRLKALAAELERLEPVLGATVYRAVPVPPVGDQTPHPARFDVAVLIEAGSPNEISEVQTAE